VSVCVCVCVYMYVYICWYVQRRHRNDVAWYIENSESESDFFRWRRLLNRTRMTTMSRLSVAGKLALLGNTGKILCRVQKGKELNDFQRDLLDIEILSNLRFGSLEIRDTSVTRVTNNYWIETKRQGSYGTTQESAWEQTRARVLSRVPFSPHLVLLRQSSSRSSSSE